MSLCQRSGEKLECGHDSTCVPCYAPLGCRVAGSLHFLFIFLLQPLSSFLFYFRWVRWREKGGLWVDIQYSYVHGQIFIVQIFHSEISPSLIHLQTLRWSGCSSNWYEKNPQIAVFVLSSVNIKNITFIVNNLAALFFFWTILLLNTIFLGHKVTQVLTEASVTVEKIKSLCLMQRFAKNQPEIDDYRSLILLR